MAAPHDDVEPESSVMVFSYDFLQTDCSKALASASSNKRIALGQAAWCNAFWRPVQQRKHPEFKISIEGTNLLVQPISLENVDKTTGTNTEAPSVDWNKLLQMALKKIQVEDLGDLAAIELLASIPTEDSEGRGRKDLEAIEKQLSVKVVWLLGQDDNHILLVGAKTKLEKKCLVLRNILAHYYWRLKGKQITL
jgi:hypothetical protein